MTFQTSIKGQRRLLFYGSWLLLGLMQAAYTELLDDEAYYWLYAKFPAWGYFDHPPMIALMVKMGYALFQNELGVRLLSVLMNAGTLLLIEQIIKPKNPRLFYTIALSMLALQIGGMIAAPDSPLIFFTALFFFVYQKFLERPSLLLAIAWGIVMALLMYSKYHGLLVILFLLLSNLKLFTRYHLYAAATIALLLYIPHLYWQWQHEWISIRYQVFESNYNPYKISYTTDYILGQFLMAGPIAGFILLPAAFLQKANKNIFERGLYFTMTGTYIFFFISSFKGTVEANWTAAALIPLVILSYQYLDAHQNWQRWLKMTLPVSLFLVAVLRIAMVVNIIPIHAISERFHSWKNWPQQMKQNTKGLPVVWNSSYQRASKYWFYTGQTTYSLNAYRDRRNNFNYWPIGQALLGHPVYNMDKHDIERFSSIMQTSIGKIGYRYDSSFISFFDVWFDVATQPIKISAAEYLNVDCKTSIPKQTREMLHVVDKKYFNARLAVFENKVWLMDIPLRLSARQLVAKDHLVLHLKWPLKKGKYFVRLALQWKDYPPTHNSDKIKVIAD